MTEERKSYVLGRGRMYFASGLANPMPPADRRWATHTLGYRWTGQLASQSVLQLRAFFVCGYDPQKLLPSPERIAEQDYRASLAWYDRVATEMFRGMAMDGEYIFFDREMKGLKLPILSPGEEIRLQPAVTSAMFSAYIDVPGEEISLMRERTPTFEHKMAVVKAPWGEIELRALAHDPRIRVIMLDVDDARGEIDGAAGTSFDEMLRDARERSYRDTILGLRFKDKPVVQTAAGKRDLSYLAHDPTKKHKRGKRR